MQYRHVPVMVKEVIHYLNCLPDKTYVDATLGGGGHAKAILEAIGPNGCLLGIDRDPDAVAYAGKSLFPFKPNVRIFHDDFTHLPQILSRLHTTGVDGILLDLGLSLYQLEGSGRGFSFMRDEPLDMRMNPEQGQTAASIVNRLSQAIGKRPCRFNSPLWRGEIGRSHCKIYCGCTPPATDSVKLATCRNCQEGDSGSAS
jgi:16S rRNA (cytosine1402-N4)-methyltransferase